MFLDIIFCVMLLSVNLAQNICCRLLIVTSRNQNYWLKKLAFRYSLIFAISKHIYVTHRVCQSLCQALCARNTSIVRLFSLTLFLVNCKIHLLRALNRNTHSVIYTHLLHWLEFPVKYADKSVLNLVY